MTELKRYATFRTTLPDDAVWDANENMTRPGGLNVAQAICSGLQQKGVQTSQPKQHSFYGWSFRFTVDNDSIQGIVQFADPWLLIVEVRRSFLGRIFSKGKIVQMNAIELLSTAMANDLFSEIQWMTAHEFERARRQRRN